MLQGGREGGGGWWSRPGKGYSDEHQAPTSLFATCLCSQAQAWSEAPAGGSAQADEAASRALKGIMPQVPRVLQPPEALFMADAASWEEVDPPASLSSSHPALTASETTALNSGMSRQLHGAGSASHATSPAAALAKLRCLLWPGIPGRLRDWMANKCPRVLVNPAPGSPALLRIRQQVCVSVLQHLTAFSGHVCRLRGSEL